VIDLHLHTTASDGRLSPSQLVTAAAQAGISVMSVTDHDTVGALAEVRRAADEAGIHAVHGIEITSVDDGRDVHILGYFIEPDEPALAAFLQEQRGRRVERMHEIAARLAALGLHVDVDGLLAAAAQRPGASVGRPLVAKALINAGYVRSTGEAFDRYLSWGRPAFVARIGHSPSEVVAVIHAAGGLASMAHPGVTRRPDVMAALVACGLDAVEVYHSDHDTDTERELLAFASRHGLLVTGGSDFHGEDDTRRRTLGVVGLPPAALDRLRAAAGARR
jgi:3',5'-nucleoside bisphosphate phosphatase